jgi:hypothetical protein
VLWAGMTGETVWSTILVLMHHGADTKLKNKNSIALCH